MGDCSPILRFDHFVVIDLMKAISPMIRFRIAVTSCMLSVRICLFPLFFFFLLNAFASFHLILYHKCGLLSSALEVFFLLPLPGAAPNPVEMRERRDKVAARFASLQPPRLRRSPSASSRRGAQVPTFPGFHSSSSLPAANVPWVPAFPVAAYIRLVSGLFWPCVPISQSVDTARLLSIRT